MCARRSEERELTSNKVTKESFMVEKAFKLGSEKCMPSSLNPWNEKIDVAETGTLGGRKLVLRSFQCA